MAKPTICICENKGADQLRGNLISAFVFATRIVQFLFYLNPKFQASSSFLCLYSLVCVRPDRKQHCWFSNEAAQMLMGPLRLFAQHLRNEFHFSDVIAYTRVVRKVLGLCRYLKKYFMLYK